MTYPFPLVRLSWGGDVAQDDIWVNNLMLSDTAGLSAGYFFSAANLANIKALVDTFYASGAISINPFNNIRWYKLALLTMDGKYLADAKLLENTTPVPGTGTSSVSPQDSVVISLRTDTNRGLANRGRIYPPAGFASPSSATGLIANGTVNSVLTKATNFFNGLNSYCESVQPGFGVVIASKEREGAVRKVTRVEVGNIMDNQKRRRNKISEVYNGNDLS